MAIEIKAPNEIPYNNKTNVFLAGSIEMGKAKLWQDDVTAKLGELDINILNPRRSDWDSSWTQDITCEPFKEQVLWEFDALKRSDIVFFYLEPGTMSPISLFEIGFIMGVDTPAIICCPSGFWRKGNLDVYSLVQGYPMTPDYDEAVEDLKSLIGIFVSA